MPADIPIAIASDKDIVEARQRGRALALELGFSVGDTALIATAISELARNIVSYAGHGMITLRQHSLVGRVSVAIVATDHGPGIADVALALRDGYSSSGGLGLGLPGVRRLMDEFEIVSKPGHGTTITIRKWRL
ncbi:MAG TPA: anti-sigma regulatory factor [Steroidobacteraceae bacterium]|nr:anti-sigma regulatory factor [Steroidobacteraceae bacterium]